MGKNRKTNILVILIFLGVIIAFAFSYNASVTRVVADGAYNDKVILQNYNTEIIGKLTKQESTEAWSEIVEQYEEIVIVIENSDNRVVTRSIGRTWSTLDVKVQTPFEYKGNAYLIKSSVYLLRDYVADVRELVKFIFVEFLIGIAALCLLIFTIYTILLRPFKGLYNAIEEYDKTGKLKDVRLKGFAGEVYKRFVSMTRNLENNQTNQRRIIASVSHDIKTPLTSIMGYSERLQKDNISEERKKRYLNTVYEKSEEIRTLIDEIDDYLSLNMMSEFKKENITLKELSKEMLSDYSDDFESSDVVFNVEIEGNENALIALDKAKFKRVLGNIFSNSLKHFGNFDKIITVTLKAEKEKVTVTVTDSGEGVSEDMLEVIFEPLYTSDEGRKVAGLGLAICREIVEGHAGKIYAEQVYPHGLSICMVFDRVRRKSINKNKQDR